MPFYNNINILKCQIFGRLLFRKFIKKNSVSLEHTLAILWVLEKVTKMIENKFKYFSKIQKFRKQLVKKHHNQILYSNVGKFKVAWALPRKHLINWFQPKAKMNSIKADINDKSRLP